MFDNAVIKTRNSLHCSVICPVILFSPSFILPLCPVRRVFVRCASSVDRIPRIHFTLYCHKCVTYVRVYCRGVYGTTTMESLDLLNLRAGECSFLEIALADVRRYTETFVVDNKKQAVLVFPPFSARNRFLIHTLVQNFFSELNTISIGSSYGRRTVVYHSSLKPMLRGTESEESRMIHNESDTCMNRAYRTPRERKAQEKLFQSLMPKKKVDKSARSTPRKQSKRPDIPIYVPKALRGLASNNVPNISSTTINSNVTSSSKLDSIHRIEDGSNVTLHLKEMNDSSSPLNLNSQKNNSIITSADDSLKNIDLKNEMCVDKMDTVLPVSFKDISSQISEPLSSSYLSDVKNVNEFNINLSASNEIIKTNSPILEFNELETNIEITNNCNNASIAPSLPDCLADNASSICTQNCTQVDDLPDSQTSEINNKIIVDDILLPEKISETNNTKVVKNIEMSYNEKNIGTSIQQEHELSLVDELVVIELETEFNTCCTNYCQDDNEPLTDKEENNCNINNEELTTQPQSSESVNKSLEIDDNQVKKSAKKKKKKKQVLDVDECSWEDLYDKEDDYIHPLLMKELISSMGKVQVKCAIEDYRSHQTVEERSGDGECVIEVYGFASDLKTIDLMNQFASFRSKQKFEIIWVDDTHALAVFESPQLADRALNTPFALVKTRPLKNAIRESKLKAETVAPLPTTRPKTCTAMARRLVSSALGLKVNVSPDLLNAERTLLANAKEQKIREAQQKHDIWNEI